MREAFLSLDEKFLALAGERDWYSGTTVLVALMRGRLDSGVSWCCCCCCCCCCVCS